MTQGIFRGICERFFFSELLFPSSGEILYEPRGDFTYSLYEAVSFAYEKALETSSIPIVGCLEDREFVGEKYISLSKVRLIAIEEQEGLDGLVEFYKANIDDIPVEFRRIEDGEDVRMLYNIRREYQKQKAKLVFVKIGKELEETAKKMSCDVPGFRWVMMGIPSEKIRELEELLEAIRTDSFNPDVSVEDAFYDLHKSEGKMYIAFAARAEGMTRPSEYKSEDPRDEFLSKRCAVYLGVLPEGNRDRLDQYVLSLLSAQDRTKLEAENHLIAPMQIDPSVGYFAFYYAVSNNQIPK